MRIEGHYLEAELRRLCRVGNDRTEYTLDEAYGYVTMVLDALKKSDIIRLYNFGGKDDLITNIMVVLPNGDKIDYDHKFES